jgi:hypothetical protein
MLKRIALAAILVVTAASVAGVSIARATASKVQVTPQTAKNFCWPPGGRC